MKKIILPLGLCAAVTAACITPIVMTASDRWQRMKDPEGYAARQAQVERMQQACLSPDPMDHSIRGFALCQARFYASEAEGLDGKRLSPAGEERLREDIVRCDRTSTTESGFAICLQRARK